MPSLTDGAERMTTFVALARRYPGARLVFSGGGGSRDPGRMREADVAGLLFDQLGLAPDRVIFERNSLNTWENALFSLCRVHPVPGERWLLVTSAFHMPRAIAAFRHAGWSITPWPVGYKSSPHMRVFGGVSLPKDLALVDYAAHEWFGLLTYRIEGKIGAPSTAPSEECPQVSGEAGGRSAPTGRD